MKQLLKKTTQKFGFTINKTVSSFNNPFAEYGIEKSEFEERGNGHYFKELDLFFPDTQKENILIKGYSYSKNIVSIAKGKFSLSDEGVFLRLGSLCFQLDEFEELYILNEIFVEGCYNIVPQERECALIDIGMNVGFCSLYFAQKPEFKNIYSFEPFSETFQLAKRNLELNPAFKEKVQPHNFGLAKQDGILEVEYSTEARGRMGINGVPADMVNAAKETRGLQLKDAAATLAPVFDANPEKCFVLKCDCEGAEYEIIEKLHDSGLLGKISYCMIEWHYRSPRVIIDQLRANGFTTITTTFEHHNAGIIYGFKK